MWLKALEETFYRDVLIFPHFFLCEMCYQNINFSLLDERVKTKSFSLTQGGTLR